MEERSHLCQQVKDCSQKFPNRVFIETGSLFGDKPFERLKNKIIELI